MISARILCARMFCAGAILAVTIAAAEAKPGFATSTVNLRKDPNTASDVLVKIPGGAAVEVGDCNDGWCAVTYAGQSGYSIATSLDTTGRAPPRTVRRAPPPGRAYADGDVVYGPAPPGYVPVTPPGYYAPRPYYYGPYYGPYWRPWGWRGPYW